MSFDPSSLGVFMLTIGVFFIATAWFPARATWARGLLVSFTLLLGLRYIWWRLTHTVLPQKGQFDAETIWIWMIFFVELAVFLEACVFFLIMSRVTQRREQADAFQAAFEAQGEYPSVDVFIPTYNEPPEVLQKTITGAANIAYPNFTVWVLDDGKRDWLEQLCKEEGVRYLTRHDNRHAKAGNMNNGLKHAKGEFVAIFDADFVPHRHFLRRTLGFFAQPDIGIVQTPQHFFNHDPIQMNLGLSGLWPDEQRLFFDKIAECRDAWDAAFCCGSCSITRRAALQAIGDQFPTESITEDLLTTLKLLRAGYKTRFLNERLSMGLAAESLDGFSSSVPDGAKAGFSRFFLRMARWAPG